LEENGGERNDLMRNAIMLRDPSGKFDLKVVALTVREGEGEGFEPPGDPPGKGGGRIEPTA
jgi:hypothetical protein